MAHCGTVVFPAGELVGNGAKQTVAIALHFTDVQLEWSQLFIEQSKLLIVLCLFATLFPIASFPRSVCFFVVGVVVLLLLLFLFTFLSHVFATELCEWLTATLELETSEQWAL